MIDIFVEISRYSLLLGSLFCFAYYARTSNVVASFHAMIFLGLLGFALFGFSSNYTFVFSLFANIGTLGAILWPVIARWKVPETSLKLPSWNDILWGKRK